MPHNYFLPFLALHLEQRAIKKAIGDALGSRGLRDVASLVAAFAIPKVVEENIYGHVWSQYTTVGGKKHGLEREWHASMGLEKELHWEHGERHGLERQWYPSGCIWGQVPWEFGEGIKWWYGSGALYKEMHWEHDEQHGLERTWYESGVLLQERHWEHGTLLERS